MCKFKEDMVSDIYSKQQKVIENDKWRDEEYAKRYTHLKDCVENLRKELTPQQDLLMQELLRAMQTFNDYNEYRRFGNGMKCMYDFGMCLKNNF